MKIPFLPLLIVVLKSFWELTGEWAINVFGVFPNIEETVEVILNKYNSQNKSKAALIFEGTELKKLAYYKTAEIGTIQREKLEKIYDVYKLLGLIKNISVLNKNNKSVFS